MNNVEKKLNEAYVNELNCARNQFKKARTDAKNVYSFREAAEKLEAAGIDFSIWSSTIYISTYDLPKDKASFSDIVRKASAALGEAPDIDVREKRYSADFKQSKVYISMWDAEDCQVIETEEVITKKVLKPHPMCIAALKPLEDIA